MAMRSLSFEYDKRERRALEEVKARKSEKGKEMTTKLPYTAEEMHFASLDQLVQVINQPRHNGDVIEHVFSAVDEIKSRGLEIEGSGEGPYTIK